MNSQFDDFLEVFVREIFPQLRLRHPGVVLEVFCGELWDPVD